MLTYLAQKLSGEQIENLVIGQHDARQMLHDTLDSVKGYEVLVAGQVASERTGNRQIAYPNEDVRKAEVARRLERDEEYQLLREKLQDARVNLAFAEAELEREKAEHSGFVALTGLLAAMVNAGQMSDLKNTEAVLAGMLKCQGKENQANRTVDNAIATSGRQEGQTVNAPVQPPTQGFVQSATQVENDVKSGVFIVLEARPSKTPGTIRGYCQSQDGSNVAIYAKNGYGQILAQSVGSSVQVSFRHGIKGLIATSVKKVS